MTLKPLAIAVVLVSVALAGTPIATVSTSGSVAVNGAPVPSAGISEWPVAAGDEIATTATPAVILFRDGTRIAMDRNTRARLHQTGRIGIDVLAGSASYKTVAASKLSMFALGRPVDLQSRTEGVVSVQGGGKVTVRDAKNEDDFGVSEMKKSKKPHPRSGHKRDGDDDPESR